MPATEDDSHVIKGATLDELADNIAARLAQYEHVTGGLKLTADFVANLKASVARFNVLRRARAWTTTSIAASEPVQQLFNGNVREEPGRTNPTMFPISEHGPVLRRAGDRRHARHQGRPQDQPPRPGRGRQDQPIPGLYGVGNCVASASAQAYWAGGATLGPILAFAYLAANAADKEPVRTGRVAAQAG